MTISLVSNYFLFFLTVQDCRVSEWGPWSPCSEQCGIGYQERRRVVLHEPANGGQHCPHLLQSKQCRGVYCIGEDSSVHVEQDKKDEKILERKEEKEDVTEKEDKKGMIDETDAEMGHRKKQKKQKNWVMMLPYLIRRMIQPKKPIILKMRSLPDTRQSYLTQRMPMALLQM